MSVTSTLMAVLTFVLKPLDSMCVAVDLDKDCQVMDALAKVLSQQCIV